MIKEFIDCPETLTVVLDGEIDQHSAAHLRSEIDIELELSGKKNLCLDLCDVSFMDSAGIGLIIGRSKTTKSLGGKTVVATKSHRLVKILELSGVTRLVDIYPDYKSAVEELIK